MVTFVSADWVSEHIGRPGYLLIDPRSAMRYLMGHLRGAVNVPFKKLQGPDGRLGQPEQLAAAFGDAGLGDDITPVLYDHQDGRNAAMAAWVLEYLGRTDVHVMDLLFDAWKDTGPGGPLPARPNGAKTLSAAPQPVGAGHSRRRGQPRRDETPGYPNPGGIPRPNGHGPSSWAYSRRRKRSPHRNGRRRGETAHRAGPASPAAGGRRHHAQRSGGGLLPQRSPGFTWHTCPCSRPATTSASTTGPTRNGWTAANLWNFDLPNLKPLHQGNRIDFRTQRPAHLGSPVTGASRSMS